MPREARTGPAGAREAVCDTCGMIYTIGEWWLCPHEPGNNLQQPMSPYTDDMIANSPVEFRTIGEKVRYMDRHNLVPAKELIHRDRNVGLRSYDIRHAIRETIQEYRR